MDFERNLSSKKFDKVVKFSIYWPKGTLSRKKFWKYNLKFFNLLGFQTTFPIARFEKFSSGMKTLHFLSRDDFFEETFFPEQVVTYSYPFGLWLKNLDDFRLWEKKMQPFGEIFQVDLSKLHSSCPKEYSLEKFFESKEYFFEHFGLWKNFF